MKAVYVMEMPDECFECDLYESEYCRAAGKDVDWRYISQCTKPEWCPLKPMPQKKHLDESLDLENFKLDYLRFDGWNACLEEIMGEEK